MFIWYFFKIFSNSIAWFKVRGKPSRIKPLLQSGLLSLFSIIDIIIWSGTRSPLSIIFFALNPKSVLDLTSSLKISPVDIWTILNLLIRNFAWVPFPAPGGPNNIKFIYLLAPLNFVFLIKPEYLWAIKWDWAWATVSIETVTTISKLVPPR